MDTKELQAKLDKHGQGHLLKFWDKLSESEQEKFRNELESVDYSYVNGTHEKAMQQLKQDQEKKDEHMQPLTSQVFARLSESDENVIEDWYNKGLKQVSQSKVAVLLLAGGQGTRLGVNYPKGMYDVGLPSHKTLYQLQAERICKLQNLAHKMYGDHGIITWYIMTSEATMEITQQYFKTHNYFGLQGKDVRFFEQHTLPCMTLEGKIILDNYGKVARAPDGNGGLYRALKTAKVIADMERRGVESIHAYCVDNILVKMADPVFIGFCKSKQAQCGAKVVEKVDPSESVGVVCKCDGKYQVVEYSEISQSTSEKRSPDGHLLFNAGNICNHFFTLDFLKIVVEEHYDSLPHHVAKKKITYVNDEGTRIKPDKPSGIKMEKFVFDVFQYTDEFAVLEVNREEEFSPLKNAPGTGSNCPETARQDLINLHYRFITKAGGKFVDSDGTKLAKDLQVSPVVCEISPSVSYAGEGLVDVVKDKVFSTDEILHIHESTSNGKTAEPATKKIKQMNEK
eukprot:gene16886-18592_t